MGQLGFKQLGGLSPLQEILWVVQDSCLQRRGKSGERAISLVVKLCFVILDSDIKQVLVFEKYLCWNLTD